MKYTVDYFIKKFNAIPAKEWCTGKFNNSLGQKCVLGHCGLTDYRQFSHESTALYDIFSKGGLLTIEVNDRKYKGLKTPKGRILRALRDIKKMRAK